MLLIELNAVADQFILYKTAELYHQVILQDYTLFYASIISWNKI